MISSRGIFLLFSLSLATSTTSYAYFVTDPCMDRALRRHCKDPKWNMRLKCQAVTTCVVAKCMPRNPAPGWTPGGTVDCRPCSAELQERDRTIRACMQAARSASPQPKSSLRQPSR